MGHGGGLRKRGKCGIFWKKGAPKEKRGGGTTRQQARGKKTVVGGIQKEVKSEGKKHFPSENHEEK